MNIDRDMYCMNCGGKLEPREESDEIYETTRKCSECGIIFGIVDQQAERVYNNYIIRWGIMTKKA